MGYERSTLKLAWPAGHDLNGLEVGMHRLPIGDMFAVTELADLGETLKEQKDALHSLVETIGANLRWWNLEARGVPVPCELGEPSRWEEVDGRRYRRPATGLYAQDLDVILGIAFGWIEAATSVDTPLAKPLSNGALSPEQHERMAALSASLAPSPGPG
jgi:hypothetical protein